MKCPNCNEELSVDPKSKFEELPKNCPHKHCGIKLEWHYGTKGFVPEKPFLFWGVELPPGGEKNRGDLKPGDHVQVIAYSGMPVFKAALIGQCLVVENIMDSPLHPYPIGLKGYSYGWTAGELKKIK